MTERAKRRESFWAMAVHISGYVAQVSSYFMLPAIAETQDVGTFTLCVAWSLLVSKFAMMGMEPVLTRYGAIYSAKQDRTMLLRLQRWCAKRTICSIIGIGLLFVAYSLFGCADGGVAFASGLTAILATTTTVLNLLAAQIKGLGQIVASHAMQGAIPAVTSLSAFLVFYCLGYSLNVPCMIGIWGGGQALGILGATRCLVRFLPRATPVGEESEGGEVVWGQCATPLIVGHVATFLASQGSVLLCGIVLGAEDAGRFAIALKLSSLCAFAIPVLDSLFASRLATAFHNGEMDRVQSLVTESTRLTLLATALGAVGSFILVWLLHAYSATAVDYDILSLAFLSGGWVIAALWGICGVLMPMCGFEKQHAQLRIVNAATTLILSCLGAFVLGAAGLAASVCLSRIVFAGVYSALAYRLLRVYTIPFFKFQQSCPETMSCSIYEVKVSA